jgi:hypothetical protein
MENPPWFEKYYETKEYHLVYCALIAAARNRGTVTYQEVAEIMGVTPHGRHLAITAGRMAGTISRNEHHHGRPMLSAIVVKVVGQPGHGFFDLARDLGRLNSDDPDAEQVFWEKEKRDVYRTWQKEF